MFSALPVINDYGPFWLKRYQAVTRFNAGGGMSVANLQNYKMLSLLGTHYLMVLTPESRRSIEQTTIYAVCLTICGVNAAAMIKHQSQRSELLSDVGKNEQKINKDYFHSGS
jgi:hypothetical protein